jgi:hypothetical protein
MSLQELAFEVIDATYARGRYADLEIILMRSNGYVNATKLCALGAKQFKHWLENAHSKDLVATVERELPSAGNPADGLSTRRTLKAEKVGHKSTILIKGGARIEVRGTYVHPLLVPHVACWVSCEFAVKVSRLVNEHVVRQYILEIAQKDGELARKNDEISELKAMMARMEAKADKHAEKTTQQVEGLITEVREIKDQNVAILGATDDVLAAVDEVRELATELASLAVADPGHPGRENTFALIAVHNGRGRRELTVTRCQVRGLQPQLAAYARKAKNAARTRARKRAEARKLDSAVTKARMAAAAAAAGATLVFALEFTPNAMHLWNAVLEAAGDRVRFTTKGSPTRIELVGMTEEEFEALVRRLNDAQIQEYRAASDDVKQRAERAVAAVAAPSRGARAPAAPVSGDAAPAPAPASPGAAPTTNNYVVTNMAVTNVAGPTYVIVAPGREAKPKASRCLTDEELEQVLAGLL